ncbi:3-carboxymuconate cyclase [Ophiocordyceps camponoti-floridani]|uniref:NCT transcriptional regulatory complex subunit B n=1 Tax=Ophiocordyceps camponoti-floridani TaxID=2030778 RepID=A0A8H4Q5Y6_9HYPO|nr:3-carboxymuconate cyclase [Ophiocordyceps camponoti-floridani]
MKFYQAALFAAISALAAPQKMAPSRVLYFLDSNPGGASIIAVPVNQDGSLKDSTSAVRTKTGGIGQIAKDMNGTVTDSVIVKGNQLFTVNAGSNSVSRFYISETDPLHPMPLGEPVSSGGDFPNSVAYSDKHKIACVTNTGVKPGVQCFKAPECGVLEPMGDLMPLPVNQTTPPVGPVNTVSDIVFNPSETALFVSVKGDGKGLGYLYAYRVTDGVIDPEPVVSRPPELKVDFSLTFFSDESAVMTDAAYGASYLSIAKDLTATVSKKIDIPGQGATCWSVYSPASDSVYVLDVLSPNVTTLDPKSGEIKFVIPGDKRNKGSVDALVDRSSLYVLQATPAIATFNIGDSKNGSNMPVLSQYLDLSNDDLSLPKATVQKIVGEILPPQGGVAFAKEARDLLIECCVEFITLISSEANEISEKEAKKTIACDHITKALEQLGFSDYVPAVLEAAAEHKEVQKGREKKADKFANSGMSMEELARLQEEQFAQARQRHT